MMDGGQVGPDPTALLLADLAEVGFPVASVTELRTSGQRYQAAVPVLLRWLPIAPDRRAKVALVRALSVPWARPQAAPALVAEFESDEIDDPTGTGLRWTIGNALEVVADDSVFDDLVRIVQNRAYGRAREMVVLGLGRSKRPEAVPLLIDLLNDDDVNGHAVKALSKLRAQEARPALERMLDDPRAWVRQAAQKAIDKL